MAEDIATIARYADVDGLRVSNGQESNIKIDNPRYPVEGARSYFSGGAGLQPAASRHAHNNGRKRAVK